MKRKALAVAAGLTLVTAGVLAQQKTDTMMHGPAVRVAELKGRGMYAKLTTVKKTEQLGRWVTIAET